MISAQRDKLETLKGATTIATDATAAYVVDTLGYHYAQFIVSAPAPTNTNATVKLAACSLSSANTTDASNFVNITGFVGTTNATAAASEFVIPGNSDTNVTAVGRNIRLLIDTRRTGRHLRLIVQPAATTHYTNYGASCLLTHGDEGPSNATEAGAGAWVRG